MEHQQPKPYDAVLGGQNQPSEDAAVLGGIQGVKLRLSNSNPQVRIKALHQALNYGEAGLDLIIEALEDESPQVQIKAHSLLIPLSEQKVKQALLEFNPYNLRLEPIEVVTVNRYGEIVQRQQRLVKYFVEDLGNGIDLEMAYIPGGTFMMGLLEDEETQHQVTLKSFYMGKFTVTKAQWKVIALLHKIKRDLYPELSSYEEKDKNRPVERVSWTEAAEFCARLSKATGKQYRLPSEPEWEYACRAGTTTPFHYGETITSELANYFAHRSSYADEPKGESRGRTTPVGQFPPNAFGLYDMHGNVWEWCRDTWLDDCEKLPTDGSAWINYQNRINRSMRGGSWTVSPDKCHSAYRLKVDRTNLIPENGFRVACEIF
ncbi:MAG: formylglycine-generating enzyme family protein [Rivularia sp. (in: cyanobacteria)]